MSIEKAIDEKCFSYLDSERKQKSKVSHIQYNKHTIQEYLKDSRISNQLKKFIFALRARMLDVGRVGEYLKFRGNLIFQ